MLIAQLSDPHLRPPGALYQGAVDSNAMFREAIVHLNGLFPKPDLVLLSGDLVDGGTDAEYAVAHRMLSEVTQPVLLIPGNHDDPVNLRRGLPHHDYLPATGKMHFVADGHGPVRIVGLDVTVPGQHHGDMDDDAVDWLQAALAQAPERPTVIMMHQPPFESGIPYIDQYVCRRGDRLAGVVARYPAVERIVCGHIHRFMQLRFGGTMLCTAPSTTTAIALRAWPEAKAASFIEPPALLLHRWTDSTGLVTHLVPIGSFPGPFPFA